MMNPSLNLCSKETTVDLDEVGDLTWKRFGKCGSREKEKIDVANNLVKTYGT